jgi:hypothetical protein
MPFLLLYFISLILSVIFLSDKNFKDKDWIGGSVVILTSLPIFIIGIYLSRLMGDNVISMKLGWFFLITIPIILGILMYSYTKKRFKKIDEMNMEIMLNQIEWENKIEENRRIMKQRYMEALQNGDKANALQLGREYYSSLGLYDEQRIQNDLLCFLKLK